MDNDPIMDNHDLIIVVGKKQGRPLDLNGNIRGTKTLDKQQRPNQVRALELVRHITG